MNWSREMGAAYSDGHKEGVRDFIVGRYSEDNAAKYDFKNCYRQGYQHGWNSMRKEYLHSPDHAKIEIARKRTPLVENVEWV